MGKALDGVAAAEGRAEEGAGGMLTAVRSLHAGFLQAAATIGGAALVMKKAFDFGYEGAQLQTLQDAGSRLAASFGSDMDVVLTKLRAAARGTVAENELILSANRAMMLGVSANADQLANLMEIAKARGAALGRTTTEAFTDITWGIGRMSRLVLDNIGIIIDADATYEKYAGSIGVASKELTAYQKRQALLNAVLEEGNRMLADGVMTADAATDAYARLGASWKDFTNDLKKGMAGPVSNVVTALDTIMFSEQKLTGVLKEHELAMRGTAGSYDEYAAEMRRAAEVAGLEIDYQGNLVKRIKDYGSRIVETGYLMSEATYKHEEFAASMLHVGTGAAKAAGQLGLIAEGLNQTALGAGYAIDNVSGLAGKFGEFQSGADAVWDLALATDAIDMDQYSNLAKVLGIASDAGINATLAQDKLFETWSRGLISGWDLVTMNTQLADSLRIIGEIEAPQFRTTWYEAPLAEPMQAAKDKAIAAIGEIDTKLTELMEAPSEVTVTVGGVDNAIADVNSVKAAIDKLPDRKVISIVVKQSGSVNLPTTYRGYQGYQSGTPFVPYTGPAVLHKGEAVLPKEQAVAYRAAIRAGAGAGSGGGGTRIGKVEIHVSGVSDPNRASELVLQKLQDRGILPVTALR